MSRHTRTNDGKLRSPTTGMALELPGLQLKHPALEVSSSESVPRSWRSPPTADARHHVFLPSPPLPPHRRDAWSLQRHPSPRTTSKSVDSPMSDTRDTPTGTSPLRSALRPRSVSPPTRSRTRILSRSPDKTRRSISPPGGVSVTTTVTTATTRKRSQSPVSSLRSPRSGTRVVPPARTSKPKYIGVSPSKHREPERRKPDSSYESKVKKREVLLNKRTPSPTRQRSISVPERTQRDWNIIAKEREPPKKVRERSPVLQQKRWDRYDKNEGCPLDRPPSPIKRVRSRSRTPESTRGWSPNGRNYSRSPSRSPQQAPIVLTTPSYISPPQTAYRRTSPSHQPLPTPPVIDPEAVSALKQQLAQSCEANAALSENVNRLVDENNSLKSEVGDYAELLSQCENRINELASEVENSVKTTTQSNDSHYHRQQQQQQQHHHSVSPVNIWQDSLEDKGRILQDWESRLSDREKHLEARDNIIARREENLQHLQQREDDLIKREQTLAEAGAEMRSKEEELCELQASLDERTRKMALEWKELQQLRSLIEHNPVIQHEELSEKREEFQRSMQEREDRLHSRVLQLTAWEKRLSNGIRVDTPGSVHSPTLHERAHNKLAEESRKKEPSTPSPQRQRQPPTPASEKSCWSLTR